MKIEFVWDENKAAANRRKHGVDFREAVEIFSDPSSVTYPDEFHSITEDRLITLGLSEKFRVLLVVHTENDSVDSNAIIRIISARKATPLERTIYEEG